jgi:hypothetical protein
MTEPTGPLPRWERWRPGLVRMAAAFMNAMAAQRLPSPERTTTMTTHSDRFVAAVFGNPEHANAVVEQMIEQNFPMDQISVLQRAQGQGDDFLGIAYANEKERFKVWGAQGALWGSLGGLLAGAAGLLLLPGVGPLLVAGPLIEAIAGAAVGAGLATAGAAATHLTIALRRLGIPEQSLATLHQAVMDGKTVVLLHCGNEDPEALRRRLAWKGADPVLTMP